MDKCKICDVDTKTNFNIDFKQTPICEDCARSIFIQQASWYTKQPEVKISLDNYCTCANSSGVSLSSDFKCCCDCGKPVYKQ